MLNEHGNTPDCTPGHEKRCREATSRQCNCQCNGWNHGNPAARPGPNTTLIQTRHGDRMEALDGTYKRELLNDHPPRSARILFLRNRSNAAGTEGGANVVVHHRGIDKPVPHRYPYHSPTGMEFGYAGSGPADLALNILAMFVPAPTAFRLHQDFKFQFVSPAEEGEALDVEQVIHWIKENW